MGAKERIWKNIMRREFRLIVEVADDELKGGVAVEDMTQTGHFRVECPQVDKKIVLGRETALAFMFRTAAVAIYRRCFPEFLETKGDEPAEQHGKDIIYPDDPRHSSNTGFR